MLKMLKLDIVICIDDELNDFLQRGIIYQIEDTRKRKINFGGTSPEENQIKVIGDNNYYFLD